MLRRTIGYIALATGLCATSLAYADITARPLPDTLYLNITGVIGDKDVSALTAFIETMEQTHQDGWDIYVELDSVGGSVEAAMQVGRIFRKVDTLVYIPRGASCLSSCIYVLAGASRRVVEGVVGIHRPYDPKATEIDPTEQRRKYQELEVEIKGFLAEMNIPGKLYDDSLFISPESMKFLTAAELASYGLNRSDPFADEVRAAKAARLLGISRAEVAERKSRAREICGSVDDYLTKDIRAYLECSSKILMGR